MTNRKIIAVDLDDVVNDFSYQFLQYSRAKHNVTLQYHELNTYDYQQCYRISPAVMHERVWDFCDNHHATVTPHAAMLAALEQLRQDFDLHLVTSRCESISELTFSWLIAADAADLFADAHFTNGFATRHPERRRTKIDVCQQIGALALIEDAPIHAEAAARAGLPVYVPGQPWNRNMPILPNMMWLAPTEAGWQALIRNIKKSFLT